MALKIIPQIMSIAENKEQRTQQYDNYLISNAIMFGGNLHGKNHGK